MWKDLNIQQKSEVMKMAVSQGLTDLNEIKRMYDASIPNIEASSVNNTYSSVPYNPSPKDVRYAYGGPLGNIYKGTGNKSQKLSKAERQNRAMWAKGQPFYKEMSLWNTGLSDVALAGILGNMGLESGFDYKATNGTHHGYLQNQDSIRDYIKKYYGGYGHKEQMQYLHDGLVGKLRGGNTSMGKQMQARFNGYIKAVANVTDPIKASQLWEQHYERSGGQAMGARQQYAKHFYDQISATAPGAFRRAKLDGTSSPIKGSGQLIAQVPTVNIESPVFHTAANDLQWQPPIVASSRQEDIAPLLVQDNKPLIVKPLEDTSPTPKDFSAIWDQIFPKIENTQEEFNPLLDPSTQFTALQSRPRYQMKPTPIINMPVSNGDNDYMLFKPLAKGGNLFENGSFMIKELPKAYVEAYPNIKVTTPKGQSVTLQEAYTKWGDTPIDRDNVPHLTDFLTRQEQPNIATDREVELAQQHRANEEFNRQVDNFFGANWLRPSQWVGAFNPGGVDDGVSFGERLLLGTNNYGLWSPNSEFLREHPYLAEGVNMIFDLAAPQAILNGVPEMYNAARYNPYTLSRAMNSTPKHVTTESPNLTPDYSYMKENISSPVNAGYKYEDMDFSSPSSSIDEYMYGQLISGEDVLGHSQKFQLGLDPEVTEYLMKNKVGRDMKALEEAGVDLEFIKQKENWLRQTMEKNVQVGEYSGEDYARAGKEHNGGMLFEDKNFISVNRDSGFPKGFVQKHEGTHLLDKYTTLTDAQETALSSAYGKDFEALSDWEQASDWLKGYKQMRKERVTTNRDARDVLLGDYQKFDIHQQNLIIDRMPDEKIIDAVRKANGYGRNYIAYLEQTGGLTPEKIKQFREAMKKVGVVTGVAVVGAGAAKKTN